MAYKVDYKIGGTCKTERFRTIAELEKAVGYLRDDEIVELRRKRPIYVASYLGRVTVRRV